MGKAYRSRSEKGTTSQKKSAQKQKTPVNTKLLFSKESVRTITESTLIQQRNVSTTPITKNNSMPNAAKKLDEKDGFSLMLLTVSPLDDSDSAQFIVGVSNKKAQTLIQKSRIIVTDYEREDIIRGFKQDVVIADADIASAKQYFHNHFLVNAKMKKKKVIRPALR